MPTKRLFKSDIRGKETGRENLFEAVSRSNGSTFSALEDFEPFSARRAGASPFPEKKNSIARERNRFRETGEKS